jgi:hypothetical protein
VYCAVTALGVGLYLVANVPALGAAVFTLSFLASAIWQLFMIQNKSITVTGDRIQMVTASGRMVEYRANQISTFRYRDKGWAPSAGGMTQNPYGRLVFDDGFNFMFPYGISDFRGLIMELKDILPSTATQTQYGS